MVQKLVETAVRCQAVPDLAIGAKCWAPTCQEPRKKSALCPRNRS